MGIKAQDTIHFSFSRGLCTEKMKTIGGQNGHGRDHKIKYDFSYATWFGSGVGMNREVPATHFCVCL